jgi:hypothetical protein
LGVFFKFSEWLISPPCKLEEKTPAGGREGGFKKKTENERSLSEA